MDLHIHSCYSFDSFSRPKDIIKKALKKDIGIIAVTDHDTIKGSLVTFQENRNMNTDLFVIKGEEIHTNLGDMIGLFLNSEIKSRAIDVVLDEINDQDGLVILPHPLKNHKIDLLKTYMNSIDFIEILNSRSPLTPEKIQILHSFRKKELGSSDSHFVFEIGRCYTSLDVQERPCTYDDLISMLRKYPFMAEGLFSHPMLEKASQIIKRIKMRAQKI